MKDKFNYNIERYFIILYLIIVGLIIGLGVGIIDGFFGIILNKLNYYRELNFNKLIPFLAPAGLFIVYIYKKYGGKIYEGMNLIFEIGHGEEKNLQKRFIPLLIIGTWITHLFGGSAGREGVAVQIGSTFSNWIGRRSPLNILDKDKIFLTTGIAAGFAGLFGTPIAAVFFSVEVLEAGTLRYQGLLPATIASFTSSMIAQRLGLNIFKYDLIANIDINFINFVKIGILGIIFGIVGYLFAFLLKNTKNIFKKYIPNPYKRIFIIGILLSILFVMFHNGRYSGLSESLMEGSFNGGKIYYYDWILKLILTVLTLSAGFQGGEVAPMFIIGSTLGAVIGIYFNLPIEFVAAIGYISVFGSGTNTFLAPIFVGGEIFGFSNIIYFFIASCFAYLFNMNNSVYSLQSRSYNEYQILK